MIDIFMLIQIAAVPSWRFLKRLIVLEKGWWFFLVTAMDTTVFLTVFVPHFLARSWTELWWMGLSRVYLWMVH